MDESSRELDRVMAPTLIVWGDQELVVYYGAGYTIYYEVPERIAADLATFVQEAAG